MPVGEPIPGKIPENINEGIKTDNPISLADLRDRMGIAKITYDTARTAPQFAESARDMANEFSPVVSALVDALLAGDVSRNEAISFLTQDSVITSEAANMDNLSEMYRRDHLEKRLDRMIQRLPKGKKIRVRFYDLVNFKNFNDSLSQEGGNRVLREASKKLKALHPNDTGGRIGDEFVYFEVLDPNNESHEPSVLSDMPDKLMDAQTREGVISVYIHKGEAVYNPELDKPRTEEIEVNGHVVKNHVTPAKSLINRANGIADQNKATNKAKHPELYLGRNAKLQSQSV